MTPPLIALNKPSSNNNAPLTHTQTHTFHQDAILLHKATFDLTVYPANPELVYPQDQGATRGKRIAQDPQVGAVRCKSNRKWTSAEWTIARDFRPIRKPAGSEFWAWERKKKSQSLRCSVRFHTLLSKAKLSFILRMSLFLMCVLYIRDYKEILKQAWSFH